jgi:hypothetical protein
MANGQEAAIELAGNPGVDQYEKAYDVRHFQRDFGGEL